MTTESKTGNVVTDETENKNEEKSDIDKELYKVARGVTEVVSELKKTTTEEQK